MKISIRPHDSFIGRMILMVPENDMETFSDILLKANENRDPGQFDIVVTSNGVDITQYIEAAGWKLTESVAEHISEEVANMKQEMERLQSSKEATEMAIKDKAEKLIEEKCEKLSCLISDVQNCAWSIVNGEVEDDFIYNVEKLIKELEENPTVNKNGYYNQVKQLIEKRS